MELRILITGGGTGGHAVPAVAVAGAIRGMLEGGENSAKFLFIGSARGVEKKLAAEAGIDFVGIATGKIRRSSNPIKMVNRANVADMMRVPVGWVQAMRQVAQFAPHVVFSTGGYVSVPTVLAASAQRRPIVAHEQTVQIGLANRIVMKRVARIALSYPETMDELAQGLRKRAVVTGNPVRPVVLAGNRDRAIAALGFEAAENSLPTIYITGGAQGSRLINNAVADGLASLLSMARVVHQCGKQPGDDQDIDKLKAAADSLPAELRRRYRPVVFVGDEIGDIYALADLIVARSGAGTVSEVCALGKPALFIPLVPTGGDEQTKNARRLSDIGAAAILPQSELSAERLVDEVSRLLSDRDGLTAMGQSAKTLSRPNAAVDLAKLVIETGLARATI